MVLKSLLKRKDQKMAAKIINWCLLQQIKYKDGDIK